jgi:hypothetical protein
MVLEDYNYLVTGLQILLHWFDFGDFLMIAAMSAILTKFVRTAISTTMVIHTLDSAAISIRLFGCHSPIYWC